jgi:uncharacterized protein (TIGR00375 family)
MLTVVDFHIHSRYSRACSQDLTLANLDVWAKKKGIDVLGTGDATHPKWRESIREELVEVGGGLYARSRSQPPRHDASLVTPLPESSSGQALEEVGDNTKPTLFLLSAEVASIYKMGDKVRRVHNLLFFPSLASLDRLVEVLEKRGVNLRSDGRPIMGVNCRDLFAMCKDVDERVEVVPAHAWTPHFGVFGSLSGFDSLEECYGDYAKYIFAIETGLSSDPKMNWQVSGLDNISLISNSDAHSLRKLGREANVFDLDEVSYDSIFGALKKKDLKKFLYTIEFFPEEGKYHLDGHADCKISMMPSESKKRGGICPVCGKKLLLGVMNRVNALGDREYGFVPKRSVPFKSAIPLEEIIAETFGVGVGSKKVGAMYEEMIAKMSNFQFPPMMNRDLATISKGGRNSPRPSLTPREGEKQRWLTGEFGILLDMPREELEKISTPQIAESIMRVRDGNVYIHGGYDGVFGKIQIYSDEEREKIGGKGKQKSLF